jgi:alcohol dehydrogenase class IV
VTGKSGRGGEGLLPVLHLRVEGEPTFDLIRGQLNAARAARCDVVVAMGGGSVLDAGKALAMLVTNPGDLLDYAEVIGAGRPVVQPALPFIAVPTTAGTGSEATRNAVLGSPAHGVKVSLRSPLMLPRVALVDPELALGLPPALTAATGMDALAQLIEPYVSCRAQPMVDALCRDGIPRVARALSRAFLHGDNLAARTDLALGALYSGIALANAGLGAVHGLAGAIGGAFPAPHGAVCAALLPGVFAANFQRLEKDPGGTSNAWKFHDVARMLTGDAGASAADGARWLENLCERLHIPALGVYGIAQPQVAGLVRQAGQSSSMKGNPVALSPEALATILSEAL